MTKEYDITKCLNGLFEEYGGNIKDLTISGPTEFYRHLFRYLDLLLRSRNSISGTDTDYIQCAACGFHSDGGFDGCRQYNGDANGAFNIARKGLIALRKIQTAHDPAAVKWGDLKIDVEEWDKFTQRGWDKDAY